MKDRCETGGWYYIPDVGTYVYENDAKKRVDMVKYVVKPNRECEWKTDRRGRTYATIDLGHPEEFASLFGAGVVVGIYHAHPFSSADIDAGHHQGPTPKFDDRSANSLGVPGLVIDGKVTKAEEVYSVGPPYRQSLMTQFFRGTGNQ